MEPRTGLKTGCLLSKSLQKTKASNGLQNLFSFLFVALFPSDSWTSHPNAVSQAGPLHTLIPRSGLASPPTARPPWQPRTPGTWGVCVFVCVCACVSTCVGGASVLCIMLEAAKPFMSPAGAQAPVLRAASGEEHAAAPCPPLAERRQNRSQRTDRPVIPRGRPAGRGVSPRSSPASFHPLRSPATASSLRKRAGQKQVPGVLFVPSRKVEETLRIWMDPWGR